MTRKPLRLSQCAAWIAGLAALVSLSACVTSTGENIPPQAPASLSGPEVDTEELREAEETPEAVTLHIVHTNDMHGQVKPRKDKGGIHALAGYVKKVRSDVGEDKVLLLDSGDIFAGTPEGNLTKGAIMVELMNELGFDAMAVGNHEFDLGIDNLVELSSKAKFPMLAANMIPKSNDVGTKGSEVALAYTILNRGGKNIGVIGLLSPNTPQMTHQHAGEGFEFGDLKTAVEDTLGTLKAEGVDLVLIVSHSGQDAEKALAEEIAEADIPVILGGHSHSPIDPMYRAKNSNVAYVQTKGKLSAVNHLVVEISDEGVSVDSSLVPLKAAEWKEDEDMTRVMSKYAPEIEKIMSEVIGKCEKSLTRTRDDANSSTLGNYIADAMREKSGADFALHNKTGIRSNFEAGDVTMRNIYEVAPFDNTLVTMKLTGAQIADLLEYAGEEHRHNLEISGGQYVYDASQKKGERVTKLAIGSKPYTKNKVYTIVTNSFLADGGDGHKTFTLGKDKKDSKALLRDVIKESLKSSKGCKLDNYYRVRMKK